MKKIKKTIALSLGLMVGAQSLAISERCASWTSFFTAIPGGIIAAVAAAYYHDQRYGGQATGTSLACGAAAGVFGGIATAYLSSGFFNKYTPRPALVRWENAYRKLSHDYPSLFIKNENGGFDFTWSDNRAKFDANINIQYNPGWFDGWKSQDAINERKAEFHRSFSERKVQEAQIVCDKLNKLDMWLDGIIKDIENSTDHSAKGYDPNQKALERAQILKKEIIAKKTVLQKNKDFKVNATAQASMPTKG